MFFFLESDFHHLENSVQKAYNQISFWNSPNNDTSLLKPTQPTFLPLICISKKIQWDSKTFKERITDIKKSIQ